MDALARLPPLRETIAAHGLDARKRLGQHFLLDLNLTRRIARAAAPLADGTVIEVGPGPGGLTRALLLEGATHVVAIEVDARAVAALQELVQAADGRLQVVQADALRARLAELGPAPRRIVANLPYNVSTALLVRWLHQADDVADMVLMFQKEVADRLVALPRSKDYGRLSVLAQHVCTVQRLFDIAPSCIRPRRPRSPPRSCACGRGPPTTGWPIWRPWKGSRPPPSASAARCCAGRLAAFSPIPRRFSRSLACRPPHGRRN